MIVCNQVYGEYFSTLMQRAGYLADIATSCQQAMSLCQKEHYMLVLLIQESGNIMVEAMCRQLRTDEWYASCPLIMLVQRHSLEEISACFKYGVSDVWCAPMTGSEIVMRVTAQLQRTEKVMDIYASRFAKLTNSLLRQQDSLKSRLEEMITHKVYCETIYSVTEGRFILLGYDEFDDYLKGAESNKLFSEATKVGIRSASDVDEAIDIANTMFDDYQDSHPDSRFDEDDLADMCTCCSELACNIVKHGGGAGEINVNINEEDVRIYASDKGTGINELFLANALFMGGVSAKKSFGFGFTILYETADYIIMATG
ncbi:hypothetical protein IJT17_04985, partial [bacterium]|nr:hypothetical protein [bacterium]